MDFVCGDAVFLGACTDLSDSGLHGTFTEDLAVGAEGLITLYHEEQSFQVRGKVYSVRSGEVRIRFNFATDRERSIIVGLTKTLAARSRS